MATTMQERARVMARPRVGYFYVYMAMSCLAVAFLGFAPTYWMPLAEGTFRANPIVHIHGLVFFSWTIFFVWQTWLAASGRLARHRAVGLIGVSFATAMTIFGTLVAINMMKTAAAGGFDDAGKTFALVPLAGIVFFAIVVAAAIANVRRPEWHKRLMLVATVSLLEAAVARWYFVFVLPPGPPGPPPVMATVPPAMVGGLLLIIAIVHDVRQRGRPHPAYLIGLGALVALKLLELPLSTTAAWHAVASGVLALAG
jgi:hypothetical protein